MWVIANSAKFPPGVAWRDECGESKYVAPEGVKPSDHGSIWYDGTAVLHVPEKETSECAGWRYVVGAEVDEEGNPLGSWIQSKYLDDTSPSLPSLADLLDRLEDAGCAVGGVTLTDSLGSASPRVTCTIGGTGPTKALSDAISGFENHLYLHDEKTRYIPGALGIANSGALELSAGEVVTVYWITGLSVKGAEPTTGTPSSTATTTATAAPTATETPGRPARLTLPAEAVSLWNSQGCSQSTVLLRMGEKVYVQRVERRCDRCWYKVIRETTRRINWVDPKSVGEEVPTCSEPDQ